MKTKSVAVAVLFFLGGCTNKTIWVQPGSTAPDFYRAKSYCEALASGATPMDNSLPMSSTTHHSGSVSNSEGGYGTFYGTSTTYNDNTAQVFANLGQSIRRRKIFDECMRGQGFVPQDERSGTAPKTANRSSSPAQTTSVSDKEMDWTESPVEAFYAEITFDNTKLLSKPAFDAEALGTIQKGERVEVIAEADDFWFKVRYKWQNGYVLQPWVSETK